MTRWLAAAHSSPSTSTAGPSTHVYQPLAGFEDDEDAYEMSTAIEVQEPVLRKGHTNSDDEYSIGEKGARPNMMEAQEKADDQYDQDV
jgi:hypothetical protein